MPSYDTTELLTCAVTAAQYAGDYALAENARRMETDHRRPHDVKLALDRECQLRAAEIIHRQFPSHPILGEEISHDRDDSQPRWIVDPIDGTVNFSHGWSIWCTSVAVEHEGTTLAGAIYAPALDELYTATATAAAQLNGCDLAVSTIPTLSEALVLTDTNKETYDFDAGAELYGALLHRAQKVRVTGSAALDICRVARGHAEGYTALGIYPWDTAAAALILERAGGRFEVIEELGEQRFRALCSNGPVHEELKAVLMAILNKYRS